MFKTIKFHVKWFFIFKFAKVKQYLYCKKYHKKHLCYPRVDIADEEEWKKHFHCEKCLPCGIGFDYIEEKLNIEK